MSDSDHPYVKAYKAGFNTYPAKESKNPHYELSEEWFSWKRGWNTAKHGAQLSGQ